MTSIEGAPLAARGAPSPAPKPDSSSRAGFVAAVATYGLWGVLPLLFKLLDHRDSVGIVANRIVLSLLFVAMIVHFMGRWGEFFAAIRNRRAVVALSLSALLIAVNWLVFIWAVSQDRLLEVSFGYFINPLVSVAIGTVLLSERLSRGQTIALAIAGLAVAIQAAGLGMVPWVSMVLALSFGFYGYVRKTVKVDSAPGLMVETLVLVPVSLGYLVYLLGWAEPGFYADPMTSFYLFLTGPLTAIPLMLFAFAARRLPLSTIGMLQYIAPSIQFLIAVFWLREPLGAMGLLSFALIWASLTVFSLDSWRRRGR